MRKVSILMSLAIGLCAFCVGCGSKAESEMLTVGTSLSFEPYEFKDENGQMVGIDIDIMQEIAQRMGKRLIVEDLDFDDLFTAVNTHKIDVVAAGLTITDERKELVNFTVPYDNGSQAILVNRTTNATTLEDLKKQEVLVGVENGTVECALAEELLDKKQIREYDDANLMIEALKDGILGAVLIDTAPAKVYADINSTLMVLDTTYNKEDYALALSKDSPYFEQVNTILQEMIKDGTIDKIKQKYNQ